MTIDSFGRGRRKWPSYTGKFVVDTWRGKVRVRAWPKPKKQTEMIKQAERHEWFRQAQLATKYTDASEVILAMQATERTALYPRDLLTMQAASRLWSITYEDGSTIYPMSAIYDITQSLDIIAQSPGDMLYRARDYWSYIPAGQDGQILQHKGPDAPPEWVNVGGNPGTFSGALLSLASDYAVPASTTVPVPWGTVDYQVGAWADLATHPTRLTVPVGVGRIVIRANATFGNFTNQVVLSCRVNGSVVPGCFQTDTDTVGGDSVNACSAPLIVSPGDYIEMYVFVATARPLEAGGTTWLSVQAV